MARRAVVAARKQRARAVHKRVRRRKHIEHETGCKKGSCNSNQVWRAKTRTRPHRRLRKRNLPPVRAATGRRSSIGVKASISSSGEVGQLKQPKSPLPQQDVAKFGSDTPMKRPAQPEEIAPAFVFFASEIDSSYVTGKVLTLLGGETTAG